MKICFFADARNVHVRRVAEGLAARAHRVRIVCHQPREIPGVRIERFCVPGPGLTNPYRWDARWARYLRRFLSKSDIVVLFFLHDWGFTPELLAHGCFVAFPQGSDIVPPPGAAPPSPELIGKRKALLQHADSVATCGPRFADIVARFAGLDADRIDTLPLGVDLEQFAPVASKACGNDDHYRVGYIKGFHAVYGPTYLVRAIPRVLDQLPTTRFDLVGDGPQLVRCRELAAELGVSSSVQWIPRQPHGRIPSLLSLWHLTVIPSLRESFCVAALESSAMCVPVVASNVGGLADTVCDGRTGLRVPPQSPEALAEAIVMLLRDAPRRRAMGEAGRAWVQSKYESSRALDQWERTFERVLDRAAVVV